LKKTEQDGNKTTYIYEKTKSLTTRWADIDKPEENLKVPFSGDKTQEAGEIKGWIFVRTDTDKDGNVVHLFKKNDGKTFKTEWLEEVKTKDKDGKVIAENPTTVRGFIAGNEDTVSPRGFYWDKMIKKIEIVNKFIDTAIKDNEKLYIITEYKPLSRDKPSEKDKFGNKNNQSIIGYTNSKKEGEIINIPDQTIFRIIGEENNMLKIETPFYGGPYFIEKKEETGEVFTSKYNLTGKTVIGDIVKKYPYIREYMPLISPEYKKLLDPIQFMMMSKIATLQMIAMRGELELDYLIMMIEAKIDEEENKNK